MLTKKDLVILSHFRNDARASLTSLSRKTSVPVSTLFDKLKKFEGGLILKHTSLVDFQKLGFDLRVNVVLKVDKDDKSKVEELLMKHERINSVFRINNGYDFLVEGIFTNMKDFQSFSDIIERFRIKEKQEFYVLEELKKEGFMSDPTMVNFSIVN
jgi:DNA-binding Lrp family transcriptional regulator